MQILPYLDSYFRNSYDLKPKESHYSSDWYSCLRKQVYDWLHIPKTNLPSLGGYLNMRYGLKTEDIIEDALKWGLEREFRIAGHKLVKYDSQWHERFLVPQLEYPISCKIDFVLHFEDHPAVGMEVKSSSGRFISNIRRSGQPHADYMKQIFIYTYFSPFKQFIHPYFGRDSGYSTEFFINYDVKTDKLVANGVVFPYRIGDVFERLMKVERHLKNNTIPDREHDPSDWQCNYCGYKDYCWSNIE